MLHSLVWYIIKQVSTSFTLWAQQRHEEGKNKVPTVLHRTGAYCCPYVVGI